VHEQDAEVDIVGALALTSPTGQPVGYGSTDAVRRPPVAVTIIVVHGIPPAVLTTGGHTSKTCACVVARAPFSRVIAPRRATVVCCADACGSAGMDWNEVAQTVLVVFHGFDKGWQLVRA
jgi:hypothetical protein